MVLFDSSFDNLGKAVNYEKSLGHTHSCDAARHPTNQCRHGNAGPHITFPECDTGSSRRIRDFIPGKNQVVEDCRLRQFGEPLEQLPDDLQDDLTYSIVGYTDLIWDLLMTGVSISGIRTGPDMP